MCRGTSCGFNSVGNVWRSSSPSTIRTNKRNDEPLDLGPRPLGIESHRGELLDVFSKRVGHSNEPTVLRQQIAEMNRAFLRVVESRRTYGEDGSTDDR